jgi:hypothetical protein
MSAVTDASRRDCAERKWTARRPRGDSVREVTRVRLERLTLRITIAGASATIDEPINEH